MKAIFEPWALGDALIALDVFKKSNSIDFLFCDQRWIDLLKEIAGEKANMIFPVQLPHTYGNKKDNFKMIWPKELTQQIKTVYSARGDPRDYVQAMKIFKSARIVMSGHCSFWASKFSILDLLYSKGFLNVTNRYHSWYRLLGIEIGELGEGELASSLNNTYNKIAIHIGAQWKAKQYPHVKALSEELSKDFEVSIIGVPGDLPPPGLTNEQIIWLKDKPLLDFISNDTFLIVNDSSAMHLCYALNIPYLCLGRVTNLQVWAPPNSNVLSSIKCPSGYKPDSKYQSQEHLNDWPQLDIIKDKIYSLLKGEKN